MAILTAPRSFRFHVVRMETCRTLLCRVHRYLLNSAMMVCLMGHTAVQTSVADGFLAVEATLFQLLIRPRLRRWPSVFRDVAFLHRPGAPELDLLMPRVLEVMAMEWESLNAKAELPVCIEKDTVTRQ